MSEPAVCARCRNWSGEPSATFEAVNAGCLWGWCFHPHKWCMVKDDLIEGQHQVREALDGLRTRAEATCPLFVRRHSGV